MPTLPFAGKGGDNPGIVSPESDPTMTNNENAAVWEANEMTKVHRFLCFGTESPTYYMHEETIRRDNLATIDRLIKSEQGVEVVKEIKKFSAEGRSPKQNPVLYALAYCARCNDVQTKHAAYQALSEVCKMPTQLFQFLEYAKEINEHPVEGVGTRGWGKAQRKAVTTWYNEKDGMILAKLVTKYRQRGQKKGKKWHHRDVLRLAHVKAENEAVETVLKYAMKGLDEAKNIAGENASNAVNQILKFLQAIEDVRHSTDEHQVAVLIEEHKLVWEHVPTTLHKSKQVWQALLRADMPFKAMIRNLGRMSSLGLLDGLSEESKIVINKVQNKDSIKVSLIHPFDLLTALFTYQKGSGSKGKLTWTKDDNIIEALDCGFHKSFKNIEPTDKRYVVAIDMSVSMHTKDKKTNLTPALSAACVAMTIAKSEDQYHILTFRNEVLQNVKLTKQTSFNELQTIIKEIEENNPTEAECSQPMTWALENRKDVDVFMIFTNSQTAVKTLHPREAFQRYRRERNLPDCKLVVCSMAANPLTIADPNDRNMLDVCGLDAGGMQAIREFVQGRVN